MSPLVIIFQFMFYELRANCLLNVPKHLSSGNLEIYVKIKYLTFIKYVNIYEYYGHYFFRFLISYYIN